MMEAPLVYILKEHHKVHRRRLHWAFICPWPLKVPPFVIRLRAICFLQATDFFLLFWNSCPLQGLRLLLARLEPRLFFFIHGFIVLKKWNFSSLQNS
jgi:hypothetical protein